MIRVYIRDEAEDEGIFLGEFFPEDISGLPSLFKEFETIIKGEDDVVWTFEGTEKGEDGCWYGNLSREDGTTKKAQLTDPAN